MIKNKLFWTLFGIFILLFIVYIYKYYKYRDYIQIHEVEQFQEKNNNYVLDNKSIKSILDDYYDLDI